MCSLNSVVLRLDSGLHFILPLLHGGSLLVKLTYLEFDLAICNAYGWPNLDLEPYFHEIEILPENDRLRYIINPAARKEVLKRIQALNHQRAAEQTATTPPKSKRGRKPKGNGNAPSPYWKLF